MEILNSLRKCHQRRAASASIACSKQAGRNLAEATPRFGFKAASPLPMHALVRSHSAGDEAAEVLAPEGGEAESPVGARVTQPPLKESLAGSAMHRLCQPLTALQCILELGMDHEEVADLRSTMADSARECGRAIAMVRAFRDLLELGRRYSTGARKVDARRAALEHGYGWRPGSGVLRSPRPGPSAVSSIRVNVEGLNYVFREIERAFASIGAHQGPQASESSVMLAVVASPRAEDVCFAWRITPVGGEKWRRECELAQPFDIPEFDFTRNPLPHLASARMVAEAMGAKFLCGEAGVEIQFPKAPVLKSSRPQDTKTTTRSGSVAAAS